MKNLFSHDVDLSKVDDLVSGTLVPSKVWPVTVTGTGIVKRGTLLARDSGDTDYRPYENGTPGSSGPPETPGTPADAIRAVLLLDVDTSDPDESEGLAAFSGEFNQHRIEDVMGITIDPVAILDAAEDKKIYIAPMNPAPETF